MLVGHYLNYEEETEMSKDIIQFTYRTKPPGTEKAEGSGSL
jgi:hypothetical protein